MVSEYLEYGVKLGGYLVPQSYILEIFRAMGSDPLCYELPCVASGAEQDKLILAFLRHDDWNTAQALADDLFIM